MTEPILVTYDQFWAIGWFLFTFGVFLSARDFLGITELENVRNSSY